MRLCISKFRWITEFRRRPPTRRQAIALAFGPVRKSALPLRYNQTYGNFRGQFSRGPREI